MNQQKNKPFQEGIMQVGMGFWPSKVLLTAVSEGLFIQLATKPHSLAEIKKSFSWNCTDRHAADFLDTLVAWKFYRGKE